MSFHPTRLEVANRSLALQLAARDIVWNRIGAHLTRQLLTAILLALALTIGAELTPAPVAAQATADRATISFPQQVTYSATLASGAPITKVVLEYGSEQLNCGHVIGKAFPEFTSALVVSVEWTWDMRQSGSLPPGATLWWRWRYEDESGAQFVTEEQNVTWLDSDHRWRTLAHRDLLRLHWYAGDDAFAQTLLDTALAGLALNEQQAGLTTPAPVDVYIYANTADMREAILYEPSWTGGLAFPDHDIVLIGISSSDLDWGRSALVHELTHVLVGHLTFTCLGDVPTWLNEGLAVYSEGQLDSASQAQLDAAIRSDALLSVRSLSAGFSEVASRAQLSYSQSYSLVRFLIETHGQQRMTDLLVHLRDGLPIERALQQVYGFGVDGLEDEWRSAIGAAPRSPTAQPTARPSPTFVPTIQPVSGSPLSATAVPLIIPTSSFGQTAGGQDGNGGPPLSLTLALAGICCVMLLLVGVLALGVMLRMPKRKVAPNE